MDRAKLFSVFEETKEWFDELRAVSELKVKLEVVEKLPTLLVTDLSSKGRYVIKVRETVMGIGVLELRRILVRELFSKSFLVHPFLPFLPAGPCIIQSGQDVQEG